MTEISVNKNIYVYGKFYDPSRVSMPLDEENWDLIIYKHPSGEYQNERIIGSLEGIFISEGKILFSGDPLVQRNEMKKFEEKYNGKFIPFEK